MKKTYMKYINTGGHLTFHKTQTPLTYYPKRQEKITW